MVGNDTKLRSLVKSIAWRLIAVLNGFIVAYLFLGSVSVSLLIALVANLTGFVLYYIHERIWNSFFWGKSKV